MKVLRNLSLALAVLLAACSIDGHYGNGDDNYFSAFASMPDTRWNYASPLTFAVDTLRDSVARRGRHAAYRASYPRIRVPQPVARD